MTPLKSQLEQELIKETLFCVYLNRDYESIDEGEIMFGGIERRRFTGLVTVDTLSTATDWKFNIDNQQI